MDYSIRIGNGRQDLDPDNDNVDVEVRFTDGGRYAATFFTVKNLRALMHRYAESGECADGLYVWAADMIVVARLTPSTIRAVVDDLLKSGEFNDAFASLEEQT